jgi:DNA mismatch repair protein MutL
MTEMSFDGSESVTASFSPTRDQSVTPDFVSPVDERGAMDSESTRVHQHFHVPSGSVDRPKFSSYREYQTDYNPPRDIPLPVPPPVRGGVTESRDIVLDSDMNASAAEGVTLRGTDLTYLGQVADTYLILRQGTALMLVDQHAAHERVLLAAMRDARTKGDSQPLGIPIEMPLHPSEADILRELWDDLRNMGFILDMDGQTRVLVRGIPPTLDSGKAREYLADALAEKARSLDDLWTMMACKTAIKAGQPLAVDEVLALLDVWLKTPERDYCPHRRPVVIRWTPLDLEKLFKRK